MSLIAMLPFLSFYVIKKSWFIYVAEALYLWKFLLNLYVFDIETMSLFLMMIFIMIITISR